MPLDMVVTPALGLTTAVTTASDTVPPTISLVEQEQDMDTDTVVSTLDTDITLVSEVVRTDTDTVPALEVVRTITDTMVTLHRHLLSTILNRHR